MPPFKFNPTENTPSKVEYVLPTKIESDKELGDYLTYLKSIGSSMGSITKYDLSAFYYLMKIPQRFSKENLNAIFGFLQQAASAEYFENGEDAKECVSMIENYRTEMDM